MSSTPTLLMTLETLQNSSLVLWILYGLGIVILLVYIERYLALRRSRIDETDLLSGILTNLDHGNDTEAIVMCDETPGPVAHLVGEAIRHRAAPRHDLAAVLHSEGLSEISRLERRLSILATIAQISPVLGLLGTLIPLLSVALIGHTPTTAEPIFRALVPAFKTTAAGLLVAILSTIFFNHLVVMIDRLVLDMEHAAAEIILYLDAHRRSKEPHS